MKTEKVKDDKSPYIWQRDKIDKKLTLREIKWTPKQQEFLKLAFDKKTKIIFLAGPAGTSKTYCAVFSALQMLSDKRISDIIYIRSAVESSDSKLGFLPGEAEDKMRFYGEPFYDKLHEILPEGELKALTNDKRLIVHPTNFVRGMSWNAKALILDECQNSSIKEIITVITRIGHFSKCFVLADPLQVDLKNGNKGGFEKLFEIFNTEEAKANGIFTFRFTSDDIVREGLVKFIVEQIEKFKLGQ